MNDVVLKRSPHPFLETVQRLHSAIGSKGNTLFADIDQAAAAKSVGLTLRPTRLLIFGNPKGGTPLMEGFPLTALDLPLKLLVWEEGGNVNVAYTAASALGQRYGLAGKEAIVANMDRALEAIATEALA